MGYSGQPIGKYQIDFTADQLIYIGAKNEGIGVTLFLNFSDLHSAAAAPGPDRQISNWRGSASRYVIPFATRRAFGVRGELEQERPLKHPPLH
jgi:hypothetical protein